MALGSNIKGITIEIGGDTTKLGKALDESNKQTRGLQKELKEINNLLKFDPGNTDLLAQKQRVLAEQVRETTNKLDLMREAERQVIEQFERGDIGEEQLRAFQREIIQTEGNLNRFQNELSETESELDRLANGADDTADEVEDLDEATENAGESARNAEGGFTVMKGALANLVAEGISKAVDGLKEFAKESIQTGMDFQASMSEVQAISGATGEDLELLESTAKEFGSTTVFSASECAQALKYMSLAGWDAQQSADGLSGVLNLASASGMDLAQASDMVTDYLSAFGLEAKDSAYFADMLAFAQANSNTSAEQLGEAYKNSAAMMKGAGQDVETVTSLLAKMADQGFKGSEAGTALSAMMRDITAKMKDGAISIGDTTVAVTDANGNYRDLTDILKDVEKATNGMGDAEKAVALASTFTADSTKGLNLLLNAGVGEAEAFEEALRGAGGTAGEMGDIMNDNASGDIKAMQSALEDLQISLFDELEPTIREIVQTITSDVIPVVKEQVIPAVKEFIDFIVNNGDEILSVIVGIGTAFVAWNVVTTIQGVVGAIKAFKLANEGATIAQWALNVAMNANPIGIIIALIAGLVAGFIALWNNSEEFRNFWIGLWEKIKAVMAPIVEWIVNFFTVTIPEAFNSFVSMISGWVSSISQFFTVTIPGVFTSFVEKVKSIFTAIKDFVVNNWQALLMLLNPATLLAGIFKLVYDNCDGFREWVDNFVQAIKDFFVNAWNNIVTFFTESIPNFINSVIDWIGSLPEKIGFIIGYILGTFIQWGIDLYTWATTEIPKFVENIVTFISELPGKIWAFLVDIVNKIVTWGNDMRVKATEAVVTLVTNVVNFMKELPGKIWNAIVSAIEKVATWGNNMKEKAVTATTTLITNVINFMKELPGKIWNAIISAVDKVATWGNNMKTKAVDAITTLVSNVTTKAKELPGKIWDAIVGAVDKIVTWGNNMKSKATEAIKGVASSITNGLKNVPNDMLNVGKDIVEGLWNGISNATDWIKKKVGEFAKGILDGMKSALGIKSPSRAFRDQVGRFISEGIGVGITENEDSPIQALEQLGDDMVNTSKGINGINLNRQLETTFNGSISGGSIADLVAMVGDYMPKLVEASKKAIILDSGVLVGETINQIDNQLANNYSLRARGV